MAMDVLHRLRRLWDTEPAPLSEERWTAGAEGWQAWNGKSPEVEFVEFVGALVALCRPRLVVETGVGQGYTTRRILQRLPLDATLCLYESDPVFHDALADVADLQVDPRIHLEAPDSPDSFTGVDLAVLDSRTGLRIAEMRCWVDTAPAGSICVVHDVSPTHPDGTIHRRLAVAVADLADTPAVSGFLLPNPRGSWIGRRA